MAEQTALQQATCVADLANAVLRARSCSASGTAIGLALVSTVIVADDQMAKTVLAFALLRMVRELDPDVLDAKWN